MLLPEVLRGWTSNGLVHMRLTDEGKGGRILIFMLKFLAESLNRNYCDEEALLMLPDFKR